MVFLRFSPVNGGCGEERGYRKMLHQRELLIKLY